jgi:hypothetical protein
MLRSLTGGAYGPISAPAGEPRYHCASNNLEAPHYRGMARLDLSVVAVLNGLQFDSTVHEGVLFHLIAAMPEFRRTRRCLHRRITRTDRGVPRRTLEFWIRRRPWVHPPQACPPATDHRLFRRSLSCHAASNQQRETPKWGQQ